MRFPNGEIFINDFGYNIAKRILQSANASLQALFRIFLTAVDDVVGNPSEVRCRIGGFH